MSSFLLQENGFFLLMENSGNIILEGATSLKAVVSGPVDVLLEQQDDGTFDISLDADGDIAKTVSLDTAIVLSLLTDKRASASEVAQPEKRRGWWGNLLGQVPGFEMGSKLWLLEQARLNQEAANKAMQHIQDCLQWLIDDGYVKKISVSAELVADGIRASVRF